MDADRGAGLAHLSAQPFGVPACARSIPQRHSHFPVLFGWRSDRRSDGTSPHIAWLAISTNGFGGGFDRAGCNRARPSLAHSLPVVHLRIGAGIWWTRLPGFDSDVGGARGHAECNRTQLDPI